MPKAFLLKRYNRPAAEAERNSWPASSANGILHTGWGKPLALKNQDFFGYFLSAANPTSHTETQGEYSYLREASFGLSSSPEPRKSNLPRASTGREEMSEVGAATSNDSNQKSEEGSPARSGPIKPPYKCEQCGKVFKTKYTLTIHLKMPSHTGARPFVCGVCGKGFRLSSTLCRHKIIHTTEKPHKCNICNKAFNRSSTLKTHIRTHSEAKEFRCELCGKGFHQKGNLRNHILIHTGEKPYRCSLCEKAFNKLSNLKFHLHVHTDNAPYRCRYCKVHFSRRCDLKEHISSCHKSI